ncbi:hypothetical protein [Hoeflea sp. IMCC20628]|uniref:hypothetical protein n=1 Tax=Hoeflea sp. IMCC20628 TaxID=1620421 RepID=UPI00063B0409|nr:hypothetical protein [Hoeflea sp. IMCC20628]
MAAVVSCLTLCAGATAGHAQTGLNEYADRPGLAGPEMRPDDVATCRTLGASLEGFDTPETRTDLWVSGPLTLIQTDEVLWYLVICDEPGIRVMCVTYSDNDMQLGDTVVLAGALEIQDETHVVLDPCLASPGTGEHGTAEQ